jgi:hypothetical protein
MTVSRCFLGKLIPSPDGSGYPFVLAFRTKDMNEQQVPGS